MLGGLRREVLQAAELAVDLLAHVLGQVERRELLAQLVGLGGGLVELAELLLDRLELLAQDELALRAVHLGLHLVLDLRADRDDLELAREHLGQAAQAACATLTSSSSACFCSVGSRSEPEMRWLSALASSTLATAICSSSGR